MLFPPLLFDREFWMGNTTTFRNNRSTWLEALKRWLRRRRRLPRNLLRSYFSYFNFSLLSFYNCEDQIMKVGEMLAKLFVNNRIFHLYICTQKRCSLIAILVCWGRNEVTWFCSLKRKMDSGVCIFCFS